MGSRLALAATFSTQHVFPQVHAIPVKVVKVLLPGGLFYAQLIAPVAGSRLALAATFSTQHVCPQVHATPVIVV